MLLRHETHFLFTGDPSLTSPCPLFSQFSTFSKITTHEDIKKMITIIIGPAGKVPEKCRKNAGKWENNIYRQPGVFGHFWLNLSSNPDGVPIGPVGFRWILMGPRVFGRFPMVPITGQMNQPTEQPTCQPTVWPAKKKPTKKPTDRPID